MAGVKKSKSCAQFKSAFEPPLKKLKSGPSNKDRIVGEMPAVMVEEL